MKIPLENDHIRLSPLTRQDVEGLGPFFSDLYSMRMYLPHLWRSYTMDQLVGLLDDWHDNISNFCYSIRSIEDGELLGMANISDVDWASHTSEIGLAITNPTLRGRGIGTQAARLLIDYAFGQMGLRRIFAHVMAMNTPSIALFTKLGFTHEGCLRQHVLRDGEFIDMHVFGILKDEWPMLE